MGAGVAGLACARSLARSGLDVVVFDKGRRPGGRLATRRSGERSWDHGAQYFTARDPQFDVQVREWIDEGLVAEWTGRIVSIESVSAPGGPERRDGSGATLRYVGVPEMNAVAARLAGECASAGARIRSRVRIESAGSSDSSWTLRHEAGTEGPFDALVVALPAPQAAPLLQAAPALQARAAGVRMTGCWAVLLAYDERVPADFDGAFVNEGPLSWIARDSSKPGRAGEAWVLHATAEWTYDHLERDSEEIAARLTEAFADALGANLPPPAESRAHRWRWAQPDPALPDPCLADERHGLVACGDWCGGPRVEGAYLGGLAAAKRVLAMPGVAARVDRS